MDTKLVSVAGSVILATGVMEFEVRLRTGVLHGATAVVIALS